MKNLVFRVCELSMCELERADGIQDPITSCMPSAHVSSYETAVAPCTETFDDLGLPKHARAMAPRCVSSRSYWHIDQNAERVEAEPWGPLTLRLELGITGF